MSRFTKHFISACILINLTQANAQLNVELQDTLQQTLEQYAINNDMQGVVSAVVFPDGSTWSGTYGEYAAETSPGNFNLQPLTTDLLYDIGSNTKSMTSTLILLLEEEGKLSIEDTLYTYIDPVEYVPFGITLKQLMQHKSGLASFTDHPDFGAYANDETNPALHPDSVLAMFSAEPEYPVGGQFFYSNTNYLLLGKVIESIENMAYHEVLQNKIFTPYGLTHMYLDQYQNYAPLSKTGTWFGSTSFDPNDYVGFMSAAWAAGGVISKPDDFASYCYQLCRGDILNASSMDKFTTGNNVSLGHYGLGIIKDDYNGREYLKHGGTTLQNSEMHYSLSSDFSVVTMDIDYGMISETRGLQNKLIDVLEALIPEALSVSDVEDMSTIDVYPNPSSDIIQIHFQDNLSSNKTVEIYNILGQNVYLNKTNQQILTLEKSEIGEGVFFVKVFDEDVLLTTKKIIFN